MSLSSNQFDVIVIGVGAMGASACYHLARRGIRVLGLDQFDIPNELSSHTGHSRLIRKAYFEHVDYVPLLQRAYESWHEMEEASGVRLYYETGLLYTGRPEHAVMRGIKHAADQFNIPLENWSQPEVAKRYPQFRIPESFEILFEPEAGFLLAGKSIEVYREEAMKAGAEVKANTKVLSWEKSGSGYVVNTSFEKFYAGKIILTAGPWINELLPQWSSQIRVTRQTLAWYTAENIALFELGKFPCWVVADDRYPGIFYGFPDLHRMASGSAGIKLALHYPEMETHPDQLHRDLLPDDLDALQYCLNEYFVLHNPNLESAKICMYTNSPDEHFIIDFVPAYDQDVIVATGFSGHGFKFASVMGEVIADLVNRGKTDFPIGFLRYNRFLS